MLAQERFDFRGYCERRIPGFGKTSDLVLGERDDCVSFGSQTVALLLNSLHECLQHYDTLDVPVLKYKPLERIVLRYPIPK